MRKNSFLRNMSLVASVSALLTVTGMAFRVYVSNVVGSTGMGLFQLVYTIYVPACTLASSGINIATVRLISADEATGGKNEKRIMKSCFAYSAAFGIIAALLLFFLAEPLGVCLLNDAQTVSSLRILAFGLPFLSAANSVNGYFTAKKMIPTAVTVQITEEIAKMAVTMVLLRLSSGENTEELCAALVFGSAFGEIFSCVAALLFYGFRRDRKKADESTDGQMKKLLSIALPTAIGLYIRSGLSVAENLLVPYGYRKYGYTQEETLSHIGVFRGMVMPLIMFPSMLIGSASKLLVPEISYAYAKKDIKKIESIAVKAVSSTLIFSFFITGIFLLFPQKICGLLFSDPESGELLFLLSALVPILYLDGIIDSILKGMDQQFATMRYSIIDSVVCVTMLAVMLPHTGVLGYVFITYVSSSVNSFLGISRFLRVTDIRFSVCKNIIIPLLCTVTAVFPVFVFGKISGVTLPVVAEILISAVLYAAFLLMMRWDGSFFGKWDFKLFKHFRRHFQTFATFKAWLQK